jgi:hypothetical protein
METYLYLIFIQLLEKLKEAMIDDAADWARSTTIHISMGKWTDYVTGYDHPLSLPSASSQD